MQQDSSSGQEFDDAWGMEVPQFSPCTKKNLTETI
jgi:hypothetical protein